MTDNMDEDKFPPLPPELDSDFSDDESEDRDYIAPEKKTRKISDEKVIRALTKMYDHVEGVSAEVKRKIVSKLPAALNKYRPFPRTLHTTLSKKYGNLIPYAMDEWTREYCIGTDDWPVACPTDPLVYLSFEVDGKPFGARVDR